MKKVFLADDDATMVSLLKMLLDMEGYQVVSVRENPGDLLECIRNEKPDVLVMDIFLKDVNGLEILRQIRQTSDLMSLKVVIASGMDRSEESMKAGANSFLLKPFMPEELLDLLRSG